MPVAPEVLEGSPPTGGLRRILLVDDDAITREIVGAMLRRPRPEFEGFDVDSAENGAAALARLRTAAYDAVLLDINLPDMSGYDVAESLRRAETGARRTLILAVSASVSGADQARLRAAGIDGCLGKPLDEAALAAALAVPSGTPQRSAPAVPPLVDDFAVRALTVAVGADRARQIRDQFWAEWPGHVTRLCAARLNAPRLAELAHRLTALAGNCGYLRLSLKCRDLTVAAAASAEAAITDDLIGGVLDTGDATRAFLE